MTRKLSAEDRQAVDLVLDTFNTVGRADGVVAIAGKPVERHVQSAEQILSLLALIPVDEPPSDLIARTWRRIEQTPAPHAAPTDEPRQMPPFVGPDQLPA